MAFHLLPCFEEAKTLLLILTVCLSSYLFQARLYLSHFIFLILTLPCMIYPPDSTSVHGASFPWFIPTSHFSAFLSTKLSRRSVPLQGPPTLLTVLSHRSYNHPLLFGVQELHKTAPFCWHENTFANIF